MCMPARWCACKRSREAVSLIRQAIAALPTSGPLAVPLGPLPAFEPAFSLVEGWRGAILHWLMADDRGHLYRVKVVDPSFRQLAGAFVRRAQEHRARFPAVQ